MPAKKKSATKPASAEKKKSVAKPASARKKPQAASPAEIAGPALYALEVKLIEGREGVGISRTIEIRGDQTFEELHLAIFDAFDRYDEHLFEFQMGKKPFDRECNRILHPLAYEDARRDYGAADVTVAEAIEGKGQKFFYWFDFGDDWWHQIKVKAIGAPKPRVKYPRVSARVGKSPPQYEWDDDDEEEEEEEDEE